MCIQLTNYKNKKYDLIDTAGIRRKTKIKETVETFSVQRSIETIKKSEVIVYVIDATEANRPRYETYYPYSSKLQTLLVVNKWDLIETTSSQTQQNYLLDLRSLWLKDQSYLLFIHLLP